MLENLKRTPLLDTYTKYGGKVIDFAGWALPVEFEGIITEHNAVRNVAGLFDVSHMGELIIKGEDAFKFIQHLITNDISILEDNQVLYTFMCYVHGGIVDDLLVYKFAQDEYLLVVNASNTKKDYTWIVENSKDFSVIIENISDITCQLAFQGPKAQEILQKIVNVDLSEIKFFYCMRNVEVNGKKCLVSRTGYTGEDGFEIYTAPEDVVELWDKILEIGKEEGVKPIGLGARDTLRFQAILPLYGNEISQNISPIEAGLGFFVKINKEEFIGKDVLIKQKTEGTIRKLIAFEMRERGIPRHGYKVMAGNKDIGFVTTGYMLPGSGRTVGLAIVETEFSQIGTEILIAVRNRCIKAEVVKKSFINKKYKK